MPQAQKRNFLHWVFFQDPRNDDTDPQDDTSPFSEPEADIKPYGLRRPGDKWVKLEVRSGGVQLAIELVRFPAEIGRRASGVRLDDDVVCPLHALLDFNRDDLTITDMHSRSGVRVGEYWLDAGEAVPVFRGDIIRLGRSELTVVDFASGYEAEKKPDFDDSDFRLGMRARYKKPMNYQEEAASTIFEALMAADRKPGITALPRLEDEPAVLERISFADIMAADIAAASPPVIEEVVEPVVEEKADEVVVVSTIAKMLDVPDVPLLMDALGEPFVEYPKDVDDEDDTDDEADADEADALLAADEDALLDAEPPDIPVHIEIPFAPEVEFAAESERDGPVPQSRIDEVRVEVAQEHIVLPPVPSERDATKMVSADVETPPLPDLDMAVDELLQSVVEATKAPRDKTSQPAVAADVQCGKCGTVVAAFSKFCRKCGAAIGGVEGIVSAATGTIKDTARAVTGTVKDTVRATTDIVHDIASAATDTVQDIAGSTVDAESKLSAVAFAPSVSVPGSIVSSGSSVDSPAPSGPATGSPVPSDPATGNPAPSTTKKPKAFCGKCGAKVGANAKFCGGCGSKIS